MRYTYHSLIIILLLLSGCTTSRHYFIKIDPPSFGAQFIPEQLNTLLVDSGFERINFSERIIDPNAGASDALNTKTGEILESSRYLYMRYQHQSYPELFTNITIGRDKGNVTLKFYETDKKELSTQGIAIYNQFKENLTSGLYDKNDFTASH